MQIKRCVVSDFESSVAEVSLEDRLRKSYEVANGQAKE